MRYIIETTKTDAVTRVLLITEDMAQMNVYTHISFDDAEEELRRME